MGSTSRAILRGVGAGLKQAGVRRREERQRDEEMQLKERELTIREQESKLRQQQLELNNMMTKSKISHGNLVKTAMASGYTRKDAGYGSAAMADAMTKYVADGRAYRHKGYSEEDFEVDPLTGMPTTVKTEGGLPIWEVGTYKTDPETGKVVSGKDGKPVFIPLGVEDLTFKDENSWVDFISSNMNPDYHFALQAEERTYEATRRAQADKLKDTAAMADVVAGTTKGAADIKLTQEKARLAGAQADAAAKEAKQKPGLSKIEQMGMKEFAKDLRAQFPESTISLETAKKIALTVDNEKVRTGVAEQIAKALDPDDPLTKTEVIKGFVGEGLPQEYMERLFEKAEMMAEAEDVALGSDSWFKQFGSSIKSFFNQ
jgi:hypothetical protein